MKAFIAWGGPTSLEIAEAFKEFLGTTIQRVDAFVSSEDIRKGKQWLVEIANQLRATDLGFVILTHENRENVWLHFEAGAISKLEASAVCTLLFGVTNAEISEPLRQFQSTQFEKTEFQKLFRDVNKRLAQDALDPARLDRALELNWPDFESKVKELLGRPAKKAAAKEEPSIQDQILGIVLDLQRMLSRLRLDISVPRGIPSRRSMDRQRLANRLRSIGRLKYSSPLEPTSVIERLQQTNEISEGFAEVLRQLLGGGPVSHTAFSEAIELIQRLMPSADPAEKDFARGEGHLSDLPPSN